MDPAKSILDRIGYETASRVTGKHISRIYRWTYPATKGGTGGVIPHGDAMKILAHARDAGLLIDETDFMRSPSPAVAPEAIAS
jgi:hypothetical protein